MADTFKTQAKWTIEVDEDPELEIQELTNYMTRPTTHEERREFNKLCQLGYIRLGCDERVDSVPWNFFPTRLMADLIRAEEKVSRLLEKLDAKDSKKK